MSRRQDIPVPGSSAVNLSGKTWNVDVDNKNSVLVVPSKSASRSAAAAASFAGGEAVEITAFVTIPPDGGWGWLVVASSFVIVMVLDGVCFTFGTIMKDMAMDLGVSEPSIALVNSIALAMYFVGGPPVAALINRFGFRAVCMAGSMVSTFGLFSSFLAGSVHSMCIFYGVIAGFGFSMVYMPAILIVGFYFEKRRSLATAIAACGSSIGLSVFAQLNTRIVSTAGWRPTVLIQSAFIASIFFVCMSFRTLVPVLVTQDTETVRTVTVLPSVFSIEEDNRDVTESTLEPATATERLFGAAANQNYPTTAEVWEEAAAADAAVSVTKLLMESPTPSETSEINPTMPPSGATLATIAEEGSVDASVSTALPRSGAAGGAGCMRPHTWRWWRPHVPHARPMYRDDIFYHGSVAYLQEYEKSAAAAAERDEDGKAGASAGATYHMSVSRAAAASDLSERAGLCTAATRRVLATMLAPELALRPSFVLLALSGFLTYMGLLVPYVYILDKNLKEGMPEETAFWLLTTVGLSNTLGRIFCGVLGTRLDATTLSYWTLLVAGAATCLSILSYSDEFQFSYCFVFGFCISSVSTLKSIMIVDLYGLEKLTNAFGLILLAQGVAALISTPVAGLLVVYFGYNTGFVVAGVFITMSGLVLVPIKRVLAREEKKKANN